MFLVLNYFLDSLQISGLLFWHRFWNYTAAVLNDHSKKLIAPILIGEIKKGYELTKPEHITERRPRQAFFPAKRKTYQRL
jgi:hypothetical protein